MKLYQQIIIAVCVLLLVVLIFFLLWLRDVVEAVHVWMVISVLMGVLCIVIGALLWERKDDDGVKMKLTPEEDVELTKKEWRLKGINLRQVCSGSEDVTFHGKGTVIHYCLFEYQKGFHKEFFFWIRRLDCPELRSHFFGVPNAEKVRDMLNKLALGKIEEEEVESITRNAITGAETYFKKKSYKPVEEREDKKEVLVPQKHEVAQEPKKEMLDV